MDRSADRRTLGEALGWWIAGNSVAMTGVCLCAAMAQALPGRLSWPLTLVSLLLLPFGQAAVLIDYIPGLRPKRWMGLTLAGMAAAIGVSVLLVPLSEQVFAPAMLRGYTGAIAFGAVWGVVLGVCQAIALSSSLRTRGSQTARLWIAASALGGAAFAAAASTLKPILLPGSSHAPLALPGVSMPAGIPDSALSVGITLEIAMLVYSICTGMALARVLGADSALLRQWKEYQVGGYAAIETAREASPRFSPAELDDPARFRQFIDTGL